MSEISDEIREFVKRSCEDEHMDPRELLAIAERVDRETVELPKSADGEIWTGREACFWTVSEDEDWHKFCGLHYSDGRWCVEDNGFERYPAASVWYERPDSLECIANELEAWCDDADVDGDACDKPRALAERIRKLAKEQSE